MEPTVGKTKTYLTKYNCVQVLLNKKRIPIRLPHKPILKEDLFLLNRYADELDFPRYRIITIDDAKTATPYLVLCETQEECEYVGYFNSMESAHAFGEDRIRERFSGLEF